MGKIGFAVLVIIGVLFAASQSAAQRQLELATVTPSSTPTESAETGAINTQGENASSDLITEPLTATEVTVVPAEPTETVSSAETPTPLPTSTPAPTPTAQPSASSRFCAQPGVSEWARQFTVNRSMTRWQVWQQEVGPAMMAWDRFVDEVESVNQVLLQDGHMFKVNKVYLLPRCVQMEAR